MKTILQNDGNIITGSAEQILHHRNTLRTPLTGILTGRHQTPRKNEMTDRQMEVSQRD